MRAHSGSLYRRAGGMLTLGLSLPLGQEALRIKQGTRPHVVVRTLNSEPEVQARIWSPTLIDHPHSFHPPFLYLSHKKKWPGFIYASFIKILPLFPACFLRAFVSLGQCFNKGYMERRRGQRQASLLAFLLTRAFSASSLGVGSIPMAGGDH